MLQHVTKNAKDKIAVYMRNMFQKCVHTRNGKAYRDGVRAVWERLRYAVIASINFAWHSARNKLVIYPIMNTWEGMIIEFYAQQNVVYRISLTLY